jgi:hypothetical protein
MVINESDPNNDDDGLYTYENGSVYNMVTGETSGGYLISDVDTEGIEYVNVFYSKEKRVLYVEEDDWIKIFAVKDSKLETLIDIFVYGDEEAEYADEYAYSIDGEEVSYRECLDRVSDLLGGIGSYGDWINYWSSSLEEFTATTVEEAWSERQNQ